MFLTSASIWTCFLPASRMCQNTQTLHSHSSFPEAKHLPQGHRRQKALLVLSRAVSSEDCSGQWKAYWERWLCCADLPMQMVFILPQKTWEDKENTGVRIDTQSGTHSSTASSPFLLSLQHSGNLSGKNNTLSLAVCRVCTFYSVIFGLIKGKLAQWLLPALSSGVTVGNEGT